MQDALARAWEKRALWQAGTDLRAWLFTIMHNVHVNQLALARREAGNVSLDAEGEFGAAWQVPVHGNQLDRIELLEIVAHMGRLAAEQREVLLLAAVEELRYEEIAAVLVDPRGDRDVAPLPRPRQAAAHGGRAAGAAQGREMNRRMHTRMLP